MFTQSNFVRIHNFCCEREWRDHFDICVWFGPSFAQRHPVTKNQNLNHNNRYRSTWLLQRSDAGILQTLLHRAYKLIYTSPITKKISQNIYLLGS